MPNMVPLRFYLQLEGLAAFALATTFYAGQHLHWWLYAVLFFAPDLSMLGYAFGRRVGALIYNLGHTYTLPAGLIGIGAILHSGPGVAVGLTWCAHIGFDRMIGFGLKYDSGFKDTHLQKV